MRKRENNRKIPTEIVALTSIPEQKTLVFIND